MMKRYIISAVLMLFTAIGFAQKDVTAQYITNADFSSTNGWTQNCSNGFFAIGNGQIGTYDLGASVDNGQNKYNGSTMSTTDGTHSSSEYCLGFECRWQSNFANYNQWVNLPAGSYELSFDVENTNQRTANLSYQNNFFVQIDDNMIVDPSTEWMHQSTSWTTHTISFSLTETKNVAISLGYGTGTNSTPYEDTPVLYVSHLKLMYIPTFQIALDNARAAAIYDATGVVQSAVDQWVSYEGNENFASNDERLKAINILVNAMTIAQNNGSATSLINNVDFSGGIQTSAVTGSGGRVEYPAGWNFGYTYDGWNDTFVNQDEGFFNAWAGSITWAELSQVISNLPNGQYRLTAEVMTDEGNDIKYRGASAVAIYGAPQGGNVGRSPEVTTNEFALYAVEFQVGENQASIGIRSDLHYYKIRNIQLTYVPTNNAKAQRDMLQQDYFWLRYAGDVDMTSDKYAEAKGAKLYPQNINQIIRVNSDDVLAKYGEYDNNIVVNGYCEYLFVEDLQPLEITNGAFDVFFAGYQRTMNYIYGTVILPWPIYEEDAKLYEAHFYEMTGFTEGTDETNRNKLNFTHIEGTVPANTPILFRMMDGVPEEEELVITSYYVTVQNTVSESKNTQAPGWSHQGYYAEQNFNTTDTYYIAHNHFWQVSTTVKVPPFRTVFRNSNSGANVYGISVDDELADAIKRIEIQESTSGKRGIYNISGQKVSDNTNTDGLAPGLYIINGNKVLVK